MKFFIYYFGRVNREAKVHDIKIGDTLKRSHYFIPFKIRVLL
jgi:hypothetical protein